MKNSTYWSVDAFYKRLDEFLVARGWNLQHLAIEANIAMSSIYMMRSRGSFPSFPSLCAICDALNVTLSEFLDIDNSLSPKILDIAHDIANIPSDGAEILSQLAKFMAK